MIFALIDNTNKVVNLIAYDGVTPYAPEDGLTLVQVPEGTNIGDTV